MARKNLLIGALTSMSALTLAVAATPAQVAKPVAKAIYYRAEAPAPGGGERDRTPALSEAETNEQVVAHFLKFKERAEKAQRAILADLRKDLDRRRAEFDEARKRFDQARARYAEIVGPLPRQGVMDPADPRLPYEFEVRRLSPLGAEEPPAGQLSRQAGGDVVR